MSLEILDYDDDDEIIEATRRDRMPRLRIYRPDRVKAVLGRASRPEVELNLQPVIDDGLPVYQRKGGGCSVVLDPGNLIVSLVLPVTRIGDNLKRFRKISAWIIRGLAAVGVHGVEQKGISDLAVGDKKVGGACIYCSRELLYYSTTLLLEPEIDKVDRYLAHPPREPDYRRGRTHREFMGCINDLFPGVDVDHDLKTELSAGDLLSSR